MKCQKGLTFKKHAWEGSLNIIWLYFVDNAGRKKDIRQFVLLRSHLTDFVLVVYCFEKILLIFGSRGISHTTTLICMGLVRLMQILCVCVFVCACVRNWGVFGNFVVAHSPFPFQFFFNGHILFLKKDFLHECLYHGKLPPVSLYKKWYFEVSWAKVRISINVLKSSKNYMHNNWMNCAKLSIITFARFFFN